MIVERILLLYTSFALVAVLSGCSKPIDVFGTQIGANIEKTKTELNAKLADDASAFKTADRYVFKPDLPFFEFSSYELFADRNDGSIKLIQASKVFPTIQKAQNAYEALLEEADYSFGAFENDESNGNECKVANRKAKGALFSIKLNKNSVNGEDVWTLTFCAIDPTAKREEIFSIKRGVTKPVKEFLGIPFEKKIDWEDEVALDRLGVVGMKESSDFVDLNMRMPEPFAMFTNCNVRIDKSNGYIYRISLERSFNYRDLLALMADSPEKMDVLSPLENKFGFSIKDEDKFGSRNNMGLWISEDTSVEKLIGIPGHARFVRFVHSEKKSPVPGKAIAWGLEKEPIVFRLDISDANLLLKNNDKEERERFKALSELARKLDGL